MLREMLRSKIHRATVTEANLHYEGSLSLDTSLMETANMLPFEKVLVVNIQNGQRFETYLIEGKPGEVCLNGAAARLGEVGDQVIIMAFGTLSEAELDGFRPRVVHVDERNAVVDVDG